MPQVQQPRRRFGLWGEREAHQLDRREAPREGVERPGRECVRVTSTNAHLYERMTPGRRRPCPGLAPGGGAESLNGIAHMSQV